MSTTMSTKTQPARYYTDPDWFERELGSIHYQMWLYAGRSERIRAPGDYFLFELGRASVLILRDQAGEIRAFHNVCRHRGTLLCTEAEGQLPGRIRCRYHAWTYRLDGTLSSAPHMDDLDGFALADYPLREVASATWAGHIFVSLAEKPLPFADHLASLDVRFRNWNMENLRAACRRTYSLRANWKLIIQNYHECLHCPIAHPQLNRQSHYLSGENEPPQPTYLGARMALRDGVATLSTSDQPRRAPLAGLTADERRHVYYYAILPNFLLNLHPDYVVTFRLNPQAVDRTEIVCEWLFDRAQAARPDFDPSDAIEFWDTTNRQDWELSDLAQRGIGSLGYQSGPYSNREGLLAALDRWVLARVGGSAP